MNTLKRSYELGVLCARADKALGKPGAGILVTSETLLMGEVHYDKRKVGRHFVCGYNVQVMRNLDINTRSYFSVFSSVVNGKEKFWPGFH